MPTESGDKKLLGNFRKLIDEVSADPNYNPANSKLKKSALEAQYDAGDASALSIFMVLVSGIAASTRDGEHERRQHDHVHRGHEQSGVPNVAQQAEAEGGTAQRDGDYPGDYQHHRDRRHVDAEQIEFDKSHPCAPVPK